MNKTTYNMWVVLEQQLRNTSTILITYSVYCQKLPHAWPVDPDHVVGWGQVVGPSWPYHDWLAYVLGSRAHRIQPMGHHQGGGDRPEDKLQEKNSLYTLKF